MSNHKDHEKHRRNDLKSLPSEVLLKARSTLVSLVKSKQEPQRKLSKEPKKKERLKSSRSEPEFERKVKHRSRADEPREYAGPRPRPLSVGAVKRYEDGLDFHCANYPKETALQRQFDSSDDVCVQSRLVLPAPERLDRDASERPRKKLSFREPEIVGSASATLGRSTKLMGVNSLTRRPNRLSMRSELHSSLDGLDSDLESQAMKIVRTVGQAFEVCHKMASSAADNPAPSTSSAPDDALAAEPAADSAADDAAPTEPGSECGAPPRAPEPRTARESQRPPSLDLLPPPPRKEGKREPQLPKPVPSISLPELPECVTKVEAGAAAEAEAATPLSAQHQLQLLRERLEQQAQQTRAAVAQLLLLRDQLAAEQAARCEAQARTHQLLVHNKELLEHIAALVAHLQEKEKGNSRPISAQQLTLLPQMRAASTDDIPVCNGNWRPFDDDALVKFIAQNDNMNQNVENNNNTRLSNCYLNANVGDESDGRASPSFGNLTNDRIQHYLISKFRDISFADGADAQPRENSSDRHFYQNRQAFPHIPPLTNHHNGCDPTSPPARPLLHAMSVGHSRSSLNSSSQPTTSKDSSADSSSSDEAPPFIMPLSHNGTLAATGEDGRVRLIVPVSPSPSAAGLAAPPDAGPPAPAPAPRATLAVPAPATHATLAVPAPASLAPAAPITRSTSEKVPNRSELMAALRSQWTRHTTK